MKLSGFQWLAVSSLLVAALAAHAETRPLYGGTLHVAVRELPTTLDPADTTKPDSFARRNLTPLMFETLIVTDEFGRMKPELATSWQSDTTGQIQSWRFRLRKSILLHDGTALTPAIAAVSLRIANPSWKITSDADSLAVECDAPCSYLPEELALARNVIVKKSDDGKLIGTGPFHISDWQPGKKLTLAALTSMR
jgi:peptide/nickel transport system substrate-binding protein